MGATAVSVPPSPEPEAPAEPAAPQGAGDPVTAAKLRVYADSYDKTIEKKRNTFAGANVTRRRAGMIAQANKEADDLEKVQQILRALADLHDDRQVPDFLTDVKHKKTAVTLVDDVSRLAYNQKIGSTATLWGYKEVDRYFSSYDAYLQAVNWARDVINAAHDPEGSSPAQATTRENQRR